MSEENLCVYDKRNPLFIEIDADDPREPRNGCYCDNCFYGRDDLAVQIIDLRAALIDMVAACIYDPRPLYSPQYKRASALLESMGITKKDYFNATHNEEERT